MKILKTLLVAGALVLSSAAASWAKVSVEYTIGNGGTMSWNGSTGDDCGCPSTGGGCVIKVTIDDTKIADKGTYWEVSGQATTGMYDITQPIRYQHGFGVGAGYTFAPGFFEVKQGEFPGVPPGRFSLEGVVTSEGGWFVARVRKQS